MLDDRFGFSTGALEGGNYREALRWMEMERVRCVELSALRLQELDPLVDALSSLHLQNFAYVSVHAPSAFSQDDEGHVVTKLATVASRGWNIVVHPDVIYSPHRWEQFGEKLLIENMDRRKSTGRTAAELLRIMDRLPRSRVCLDLAHARQFDTTLTLLWSLTTLFKDRIAEVHISDLDSRCRHHVMSWQSIKDYQHFAPALRGIPIIIESMLYKKGPDLREQEFRLAREAMP